MRTLSKIIVVSAFGVMLANAVSAQETTFYRIGTGPTADTLYTVGTAIAVGIRNPPGSRPCDKGGSCGVASPIATARSTSFQANVYHWDPKAREHEKTPATFLASMASVKATSRFNI